MFTTTLGAEHIHLSEVELELGTLQRNNGNLEQAAEHAGRTTATVEKALGTEHPSIPSIRRWRGLSTCGLRY